MSVGKLIQKYLLLKYFKKIFLPKPISKLFFKVKLDLWIRTLIQDPNIPKLFAIFAFWISMLFHYLDIPKPIWITFWTRVDLWSTTLVEGPNLYFCSPNPQRVWHKLSIHYYYYYYLKFLFINIFTFYILYFYFGLLIDSIIIFFLIFIPVFLILINFISQHMKF